MTGLTVIVDHNKVQSDKLVGEIVSLGDVEAKFRASGWYVTRCDGHDHAALERLWGELRNVTDRPKAVFADTIKGRGVSFMEHERALSEGAGITGGTRVRRQTRLSPPLTTSWSAASTPPLRKPDCRRCSWPTCDTIRRASRSLQRMRSASRSMLARRPPPRP